MKKSPVNRLLLPLSWLYGLAVRLRNLAFDYGWLRSHTFALPVVCVGNLAVGGTGKTPHTEYLIGLLCGKGLHVATLSRGYRRRTRGFVLATASSTAADVGDEPAQMKAKYPDATVAVCEDRCEGIRQLMNAAANEVPDVVVLDDAYQHRHVSPGLSILLTDYHRLFCNDALLPAGRLREPWQRGKERAHIVVVSKCPYDLAPKQRADIARRLALRVDQRLYFSSLLYRTLRPVFPQEADPRTDRRMPQADEAVLVVTGIARPEPLLEEISRHTANVTTLTFADHHNFSEHDLKTIGKAFDRLATAHATARLIITTEKDAVRLRHHPHFPTRLRPYLYALPIEVDFLFGEQQSFNQNIITYVSTHSRDCRIPAPTHTHGT